MSTIRQEHATQRRFATRDVPVSPVPEYDSAAIKALRGKLHLSQAMLATILNTSLSTVRQWEIGIKRPGGTSAKLLDLLNRKGIEALS
jgi:putative transcriptional regulator